MSNLISDIDGVLKQFDDSFPSIKAGEVTKMNQAIAMLNGVNPKISELGAVNPKKANEYVDAFNKRMAQVKELSQQAAPPKPVTKTTNLVEKKAPITSTGWQDDRDEEEIEYTLGMPTPKPKGPVTLPADVGPIIAEFERIYQLAQRIDQNAVWTGKSNEVVHAWDAFLKNKAPRFVEVVKEFGSRDEQLKNVSQRYNQFPDMLTATISRYDLDDRAKSVIKKFLAEYQGVVDAFKRAQSKSDAQRYYGDLQRLRASLEGLRIPTHPTVASGLEASQIELQNMAGWLQQN